MSEFKREARYYVIKRSDLKAAPVYLQVEFELAIEKLSSHVPAREYLTIESDWPEYGPAWAAIESRVAGSPAKAGHGEAVAYISEESFSSDGTSDIITCNLPTGTPFYADPPSSADAVSVPVELLMRLTKRVMLRSQEEAHADACDELRALLAQSQEVKS